jgi:hypothetical protein
MLAAIGAMLDAAEIPTSGGKHAKSCDYHGPVERVAEVLRRLAETKRQLEHLKESLVVEHRLVEGYIANVPQTKREYAEWDAVAPVTKRVYPPGHGTAPCRACGAVICKLAWEAAAPANSCQYCGRCFLEDEERRHHEAECAALSAEPTATYPFHVYPGSEKMGLGPKGVPQVLCQSENQAKHMARFWGEAGYVEEAKHD